VKRNRAMLLSGFVNGMRVMPLVISGVAFPGLLCGAPIAVAEVKRDGPVDFAKDIHPLLKRSCLACHNTTKAKAGLNLESPAAIMKGGDTGPAAEAGKGLESLLVRTSSHAEDPAMPPPGNKVNATDLSPEELGLLKLWIDQGMKGGAVVDNVAAWRVFPTQLAPVAAAAMSSGGRLAAAARGNQVQVTEVATGVSLGFLTDPELAKLELYAGKAAADRDAVLAVAFGTDELLATGGYRTARLWRRGPLTAGGTVELPGPVTSVAGGGKVAVAGEASGLIRLWDPGVEKPVVAEWKEHGAAVKALAVSADGRFVVSAAEDKSVRVWLAAEGRVVNRGEVPAAVVALGFLKGEAEVVAACADGMLRVYGFPAEGAALAMVREHKIGDAGPVSMAVPDAAGTRVVWTNAEPVLHVTETADGKRQDIPLEHPALAGIAAAERRQQAAQRQVEARKARLAAAVEAVKKENENLKATHVGQEKARGEHQRKSEAARVAAAALQAAPEDKARKDAAAKAVEEADKAMRAFSDARANAELAVRLTGTATGAQGAAEGAAAAAEAALAEAVASVEALKKAIVALTAPKSMILLDGGRTALVSFDGGVLQWHAAASGAFLDATDGAVTAGAPVLLAAQGDGVLAARADKKVVRLPGRRGFVLERTIGKPDDAGVLASRVTALAFSSDARVLATGGGVPSRSGEVKLWNTADGAALLTIPEPHSDTVNALAFSPDDGLIATAGSDRWARVFRTDDGKRTAAFEGHSGAVLSIGWRSDGLAMATGGSDKTLRFWDLLEGKQTKVITSFGKEVSAVAWLGTGDTVASASGDEGVRLNEEKLPGAKGFCFTVASDAGGKFVAAGGEDGVLRIWDAAAKKLVSEAK